MLGVGGVFAGMPEDESESLKTSMAFSFSSSQVSGLTSSGPNFLGAGVRSSVGQGTFLANFGVSLAPATVRGKLGKTHGSRALRGACAEK